MSTIGRRLVDTETYGDCQLCPAPLVIGQYTNERVTALEFIRGSHGTQVRLCNKHLAELRKLLEED